MIKEFLIEEYGKEVLELQKRSYQVEAELIGSNEIPPLKETLAQLKQCGEAFIGYFIDEELVGVLSFKIVKDVIDLHRVMVHPAYFRKGIAKQMVEYIEKKWESRPMMIVSTGAKNLPAIKFYSRLGFEKSGESVFSDIGVIHFMKRLKRDG
ncbi:GNAT family N-acetyltransferase [Bacillus sp. 7504-2]|nr:GNAT family N-acetyltransferase [Bacillus sp. 7504-2]